MSRNADNIKRYYERKRQAGYQRLNISLTPEAFEVLRRHMGQWETWGEAVSRLLVNGNFEKLGE